MQGEAMNQLIKQKDTYSEFIKIRKQIESWNIE